MYFSFRHVFCIKTCILGLDIYFRVTHTSFAFKCVFCVQTCILRSDMYFAFTQCICVQTCILRCPYFFPYFPQIFSEPILSPLLREGCSVFTVFCVQTCILLSYMYCTFRYVTSDMYFAFRHVFCVPTCIFLSNMYFAFKHVFCIQGTNMYLRTSKRLGPLKVWNL